MNAAIPEDNHMLIWKVSFHFTYHCHVVLSSYNIKSLTLCCLCPCICKRQNLEGFVWWVAWVCYKLTDQIAHLIICKLTDQIAHLITWHACSRVCLFAHLLSKYKELPRSIITQPQNSYLTWSQTPVPVLPSHLPSPKTSGRLQPGPIVCH